MKSKMPLICGAVLFFGFFFTFLWYGSQSLLRRSDMLHMEVLFRSAEKLMVSGQSLGAAKFYRAATTNYQRGLLRAGWYPQMGGEYLTAGNCYWQQRQLRAAMQCYELGLECAPYSIGLLTSLGSCAFSVGEYDIAKVALEKSQIIYPLKPSALRSLQQLKNSVKGVN